jgi:tetratricopeptide (TPR) repeat protein
MKEGVMKRARLACALVALAAVVLLAGCGADPAFTSGKVYLGQENYAKAIEQLTLAIRNDPSAWEPHMWLGKAYADTDELEMAHDEFFTALDLAQDEKSRQQAEDMITNYWLVYYKQGEQFNEAAKFEDAIAEFEKAIVIDSRKPDAYINMGFAYHMSGQYDRAVEFFEQAYEYAPDNEILIENLVNTYEAQGGNLAATGDYEGALVYFEKIVRIAPDTPDLNYNMALMSYQLKDYREALKYYGKQLELDPADEDVLYRIFLCHWALGNDLKDGGQEDLAKDEFRAAVEPLTALVELDDTNVTYHRALMRVYNELGQEDEALVELRRIEELLQGGGE